MTGLALYGAVIVNGLGGARTGTVCVDGATISEVGDRLDQTDDALALTGCTLLPGLIDAHTHLGLVGNMHLPPDPWAAVAAQIFANCGAALDAGFTSVRDVGGIDGAVAALVDSGAVRGPRIFPSGPIISEAGGNGDLYSPWSCASGRWSQGLPGMSTVGASCRGPEDVRTAARLALRRGATQLKVSLNALTALGETGGDTEFSLEEVRVAVYEARAKRTYVTAHTLTTEAVRLALAAGIECLEHGGIGDDAVAGEVAAAGVPLVPTLTQVSLTAADTSLPDHVRLLNDRARVEMTESLLRAARHGVLLGSGSDLEGVVQAHRGSEIHRRAAIQDPMTAIVSTTSNNARILRRPDLGRIEVGATADLVAIRGDVLQHPELFANPDNVVLVVKNGVVVKTLL